jgi:prepilin-type N-terminal cleavage/methylation domain-containing protein
MFVAHGFHPRVNENHPRQCSSILRTSTGRSDAHSFLAMQRLRSQFASSAAHVRGFTLVELLVVVAIIGILLALLLPSIQSAREASRRSSCRNNLRQMGLAFELHHNTMKSLPYGSFDHTKRQISWSVYLLPFLEEASLADRFKFNLKYNHPTNRAVVSTVVPVFICPSTARMVAGRDAFTVGDKNSNGSYDDGDWAAVNDYGGIYGSSLATPKDNGVLIYNHTVKHREITDGASHTIILAEDAGRGWQWDGEWANGGNIYDQIGGVNLQQNNEMWSDHPAGVQVLLCDGSVQFIANNADANALLSMCTRSGQEMARDALND